MNVNKLWQEIKISKDYAKWQRKSQKKWDKNMEAAAKGGKVKYPGGEYI